MLAGHCVCKVYEQPAHASLLKESAKQYEQEYIGGGHAQRSSEYAVEGKVHVVHYLAHAVAPVAEGAGYKVAELGVKKKCQHDYQYRHAYHPTAALHQQQYTDRPHNYIHRGVIAHVLNDILIIERDVQYHGRRKYCKNVIVPLYLVLCHVLACGVKKEYQQQRECKVYRAQHLSGYRPDACIYLEQGKGYKYCGNNKRNSLWQPVAEGGFAVILFKHLSGFHRCYFFLAHSCGIDVQLDAFSFWLLIFFLF